MTDIKLPPGFSRELPTIQNSIAIFSNWTSVLPIPDTNVGTVPLFDAEQDPRVIFAVKAFGPLTMFDVLELGSFEGGHTYQLEQVGIRSLLSIEANAESFLKALLVKEALDLKAKFLYGDFLKYLENNDKHYDLIFASGVLYHMVDPLHLLHLIAEHATRTFIWSHYVGESWGAESFEVQRYGYQCRYHRYDYEPAGHGRSYSGTETYCCRLRKEDIYNALKTYGFEHVEIVKDEPDGLGGPHMSLVARK
jgi:hypothetical protein